MRPSRCSASDFALTGVAVASDIGAGSLKSASGNGDAAWTLPCWKARQFVHAQGLGVVRGNPRYRLCRHVEQERYQTSLCWGSERLATRSRMFVSTKHEAIAI